MNPAQGVAKHSRLQQSLHRIIDSGKHCITNKGEDDGVGMQRSYSAEARVLQIEIENRIKKLDGCQQAYCHSYNAENDGRYNEEFYDLIVVVDFL